MAAHHAIDQGAEDQPQNKGGQQDQRGGDDVAAVPELVEELHRNTFHRRRQHTGELRHIGQLNDTVAGGVHARCTDSDCFDGGCCV